MLPFGLIYSGLVRSTVLQIHAALVFYVPALVRGRGEQMYGDPAFRQIFPSSSNSSFMLTWFDSIINEYYCILIQ